MKLKLDLVSQGWDDSLCWATQGFLPGVLSIHTENQVAWVLQPTAKAQLLLLIKYSSLCCYAY